MSSGLQKKETKKKNNTGTTLASVPMRNLTTTNFHNCLMQARRRSHRGLKHLDLVPDPFTLTKSTLRIRKFTSSSHSCKNAHNKTLKLNFALILQNDVRPVIHKIGGNEHAMHISKKYSPPSRAVAHAIHSHTFTTNKSFVPLDRQPQLPRPYHLDFEASLSCHLHICCYSSPVTTKTAARKIFPRSSTQQLQLILDANSHIEPYEHKHRLPRTPQQEALRATNSRTLDVHNRPHVQRPSPNSHPVQREKTKLNYDEPSQTTTALDCPSDHARTTETPKFKEQSRPRHRFSLRRHSKTGVKQLAKKPQNAQTRINKRRGKEKRQNERRNGENRHRHANLRAPRISHSYRHN